jgi:hypothetical protein
LLRIGLRRSDIFGLVALCARTFSAAGGAAFEKTDER